MDKFAGRLRAGLELDVTIICDEEPQSTSLVLEQVGVRFGGIARIGVELSSLPSPVEIEGENNPGWQERHKSILRRSRHRPESAHNKIFFFATLEQAKAHNEKKTPVRRPSTPTQSTRPKPWQKGPRSSPLSIQHPLAQVPPSLQTVRVLEVSLLGIEDRFIVQDEDLQLF